MSKISPEHRRILAGYRMPSEWAPHIACYLAWPHNRDTWPDKFDIILPIYAEMVAVLWDAGQVTLALELEALWNDLAARMPCCGAVVPFTALTFDWPAGFARFRLSIDNPQVERPVATEIVRELERILGCSLTQVWALY